MASSQHIDNSAINFKNSSKPKIILLFSGKRKCGKDYITNNLYERIGSDNSVIIKISAPIKSHWAKSHGLNIDQLMGDGKYKENYRLEMAKWGENIRNTDQAYDKSIWIVSDIRRKTDIQWFTENFKDICKTIRIESDDSIRIERGWTFVTGIDDAETECDLDDVNTWDLKVTNNTKSIECILQQILELIN
ncbi:Phosphomevalonate kinase [Apis cerana cerana]|uniref:Phosphomevalonate kinase n=1 Tax=Apis cerana cerana TaxID=94128 RepID=A0A2A3EI14_APICC|nr:Phosphomevalonate kinase [Apis cerana cerana]